MSRERIEAWHSKIPSIERGQPLIILEGTAYSTNQVLAEVTAGTALGNQLQRVIEQRQFTEVLDKYGLAVGRLKERVRNMDPGTEITVGTRTLTPEELMHEIQEGTRIGRMMIEAETRRVEEVLEKA